MACTAYLYQHKNYGGEASAGFSSTFNDVEDNGFGRNRASSYKLTGDCNSTVISMCRHDQWHSLGEECRYMQGEESNLGHRRKYNDNNWNDDVDSIVVEHVPRANANQMEYDLDNKHYTPASPGDGYCGGCRLWPQVKDRGNHKFADRDDVWMGDHDVGYGGVRPCPGGSGYFTSGKGIKCIYSKIDDGASLRTLHSTVKNLSGDQRLQMYDHLKHEFCAVGENRNKDVGEARCSVIGDAAALARSYCSVGDRIKTDDSCAKDIVGTKIYSELADAFCKNNPQDAWCSCYNTFEKVCDTNGAAAGCANVKEEHDAIMESLPEDKLGEQARRELNNRKTCRANICTGTQKYIPENLPGCELDISMCIPEVKIRGNLVDVGINVQCGDEYDSAGNQGSGSGASNKKNKDDYAKTMLKIGGPVVAVNSISITCLIVLVILAIGE